MAVQNVETISQKQDRERKDKLLDLEAEAPVRERIAEREAAARARGTAKVQTKEGLDKPFSTPRVAVRTDPATGQVERRTVTSMRELRALRDEGFQFMSLPSAQVSEQTADQQG
jgi:hypothetical protein